MGAATEQELTGYQDRLLSLKTRLTDYKAAQGDVRFQHTCPDSVLLVAIDGLLDRLHKTDANQVTLDQIVGLSDDVTEIIKSAEQFLSLRETQSRRMRKS